MGFIGIYSINRACEWLWLEIQEAPQNGQNMRSFQVRTQICHIVPVSHAYGGVGRLGEGWEGGEGPALRGGMGVFNGEWGAGLVRSGGTWNVENVVTEDKWEEEAHRPAHHAGKTLTHGQLVVKCRPPALESQRDLQDPF